MILQYESDTSILEILYHILLTPIHLLSLLKNQLILIQYFLREYLCFNAKKYVFNKYSPKGWGEIAKGMANTLMK